MTTSELAEAIAAIDDEEYQACLVTLVSKLTERDRIAVAVVDLIAELAKAGYTDRATFT
jgi:hypothetical protein